MLLDLFWSLFWGPKLVDTADHIFKVFRSGSRTASGFILASFWLLPGLSWLLLGPTWLVVVVEGVVVMVVVVLVLIVVVAVVVLILVEGWSRLLVDGAPYMHDRTDS